MKGKQDLLNGEDLQQQNQNHEKVGAGKKKDEIRQRLKVVGGVGIFGNNLPQKVGT